VIAGLLIFWSELYLIPFALTEFGVSQFHVGTLGLWRPPIGAIQSHPEKTDSAPTHFPGSGSTKRLANDFHPCNCRLCNREVAAGQAFKAEFRIGNIGFSHARSRRRLCECFHKASGEWVLTKETMKPRRGDSTAEEKACAVITVS
jgi:hypothetical protein